MNDRSIADETLCAQVAAGDEQAEETLVLRYARVVRAIARPYFLVGGDSEDLIQEGMMGLVSAIRTYRPERSVPFGAYAALCIRRRMISAVRAAAGGKHTPLNDSVSLSLFLAEQAPFPPTDQDRSNPEEVVIRQEALSALEETIQSQLTRLERQVLSRYLEGASYSQIAEEIQRPTKSVDNAVQRIRRKVARYLFHSGYSES